MVLNMRLNNDLFNLSKKYDIGLRGMTDTSFCLYINEYFKNNNQNIVIITPSLFEANNLLNDLLVLEENVLLFPMDDFLTSQAIAISPDLKITRLETMNNLLSTNKHIVITHLMGALRFLPTKEAYKNSVISLKVGENIDIKNLVSELINIGYIRDTFVSKTTDFAERGYIIDVFPVSMHHPVRIEFFGDEIESIRIFDEESQKSLEAIDEILIYPATELIFQNDLHDGGKDPSLLKNNVASIIDYLDDSVVFIKDYNQMINLNNETLQIIKEYNEENHSSDKYMFDFNILEKYKTNYYLTHDTILPEKNIEILDFKIKEVPKFHENLEGIELFLQNSSKKTIIICLKDFQIKALTRKLSCNYLITKMDEIIPNHVNFIDLELSEGFCYEDYIIITSNDLFDYKRTKNRYKTNFKYSTKIKDINKLEIGDYIVHNINGIGIYNGIKTLFMNSVQKDYIELLYKNNDKLYIPVEKIDLISKYTGKEGVVPKINSLNSSEWQKTKLRVKEKVKNIACELLKIYAERESQKGIKYGPDDELQLLFENEFEYDLTDDQLLATRQIKNEMETSHPMDRLLCGDVGFGKTEVAFRAIFKAIMNGKQAIYLCPTTILSMQQYNNAIKRFKNFPVNIELLNRFVPVSKANDIIKRFNEGKVDFLIGTHKVLNDSIKAPNLGFLVIDEEQRFGVTHKEKIKKYKSNIDVLTLTATPIPRTLQMSLVGIRSLSLITTPPVNRFPIQTYVVEENKNLIKDAIYKELARSGQVFILYNHVDTIERKVYEIMSLVPEARVLFAHGQMDRLEIENRMIDFTSHKADIMICTTIIETGIDIPNVNTLIILEADHFGLSQLYQIRGRVGRSDKIAYAYMMYKKGKVLGESAIKRLKAIEEFTELGSGFKIANRDLSIRGAGDILGSEQAGFIDSVGIDLYLKILNEEVNKLNGTVDENDDIEKSDNHLINVSTHIKDDYVYETELKIEIHKMINSIDSYEKLQKVKMELEDRFGKIDHEMEIYMYEEWFINESKKLEITKINETKTTVEIIFSKNKSSKIDGEKLFIDSYKISPYFKFKYHNECLSIILETVKLEKHYVYYLIKLINIIK